MYANASYQRGYSAELARIARRDAAETRRQDAKRAPRGRLSALAS
jgi:hypothetical protein